MSIIDKIEKFGKKAEIWSKSLYKNPTYWKFMFTLFALKILLMGNDTSWLADLILTAS